VTKQQILFLFKALVSFGVLFFLLKDVNSEELFLKLKSITYFHVLTSLLFSIFAVIIISYRWRLILHHLKIKITFLDSISATFSGLFIGQVLPGAIGIDVVRGMMVWKKNLSKKNLILSLIFDRAISLFAILLIITCSIFFLLPYFPNNLVIAFYIAIATLLISILILILLVKYQKLNFLENLINLAMKKLGISDHEFSLQYFTKITSLSILGHFFIIISAFFLSLSIGMDSKISVWFLLMPIIIFATAVPISINGWGVREGAMVYLWKIFGVPENEILLTSLCIGFVSVLASLPGIWFWIKRKNNIKTELKIL